MTVYKRTTDVVEGANILHELPDFLDGISEPQIGYEFTYVGDQMGKHIAHPVSLGNRGMRFVDATKEVRLRDGVYQVIEAGGLPVCMIKGNENVLIPPKNVFFIGIKRITCAGKSYRSDQIYDAHVFGFVRLREESLWL